MINRRLLTTLTLMLAVLAMAHSAVLAADSRMVQVHNPATLNGVKITAGQYKVTWQPHSPEVTVTFVRDDKVVVTAEGKHVDRDAQFNRDAVIYKANPDGSQTITELRFKNMKQVIVFGQ
jgi:hypothetical protein